MFMFDQDELTISFFFCQ